MTKNTLGSRIRYVREQAGLTQEEFATQVGVVRSSQSSYEKDASSPKTETTTEICARFHISPQWLLMGIGEPFSKTELVTELDANSTDVNIIMVPMVEALLSAGSGSFETSDYSERKYAFRNDFLARKGNVKEMVLMRVSGDSMEPSIEDGDVVLIDQSQKDILPGRILAVGIQDLVYLKRINARPDKLILTSDNENYLPIEVDMRGDLCEHVRIIGKVIWSCREW